MTVPHAVGAAGPLLDRVHEWIVTVDHKRLGLMYVLYGILFDRTKFRAPFAADVSADAAAFMADSQVPWGLEALNGTVSEPAWKTKPSWYLVTTEDRMIPPDAQRAMSKRAGSTVAEVKGSHAVYVSQPKAVAALIAKAANGVALATR
jgi:pimeloyl-ACP methyl ester carboxylesterase